MKNKRPIKNKEIIDVINDFDPTVQSEEYNEKFKEWRRKKASRCVFSFSANKKERVFNDSRGFENKSIKQAENKAVTNIMHVVGIAMLIYVVIDMILGTAAICVLDLLGVNVHTFIFSSDVYGGSAEIVSSKLAISSAALIAPIIYIHKKVKAPLQVEFMFKVTDSVEILSSLGMALVVCTIVCLPTAYSSSTKEIYQYFRSINADVSVWDQKEFVVYAVFEVVIFSILRELLLRGGAFAALRQFGDAFAIAVTTIVSVLLSRDFYDIPAAALVSIVASIAMLRSGSIIAAIFVRVIYKLYQLALIVMEGDRSINMTVNRNIFMIVVFLCGVILALSAQLTGGRKDKRALAVYKSETSFMSRLGYALARSPFCAIAGVCVIQALTNFIF